MKSGMERLLLGLVLVAGPAVYYVGLLVPELGRHEALHHRIEAAAGAAGAAPAFTPLTAAERESLAAPSAPWRVRIPGVAGDSDRMAYLDAAVVNLNAALAAKGVRAASLRATWGGLEMDFTLPGGLPRRPRALKPVAAGPEGTLAGWVMEVEIAGGTAELFKALSALSRLDPILEPVGIRWGKADDPVPAGEDPARRQTLLVRCLYLEKP